METKAVERKNAVLCDLVRRIDAVMARGRDEAGLAERVGGALRPFLGRPGLLEPAQRESDPTRYRQHVLHVAGDGSYSIVALVWLPGQATAIHDHVTWCVVGVHEGCEREVQYDLVARSAGEGGDYLLATASCLNPVGTVATLTPPGDVHLVVNPGPGTAISLHIYGADVRKLGSSIRRRYDQPVHELEPVRIAS
jgi:predicted metal-dependent enzyme (double-stranded beta helix superfamily)